METNNMTTQELLNDSVKWGRDKGITGPNGKATILSQLNKMMEEITELGADLGYFISIDCTDGWKVRFIKTTKKTVNIPAAQVELGDVGVCGIQLAQLLETTLEDCIEAAHTKNKSRTGKMIDGAFVKDK
jgi:hypothetical protein